MVMAHSQGGPDLSGRDLAVLRDLARVRLLTGAQLERLHFRSLATPNARGSARRRALHRLQSKGLVTTLPRRVGGVRAGSAGLVYTLDAGGQRLLSSQAPSARTRRPWSIGWLFVQHTLDVAELYVRLREAEASHRTMLLRFDAEPAAWYRSPLGVLKPDAYAVYDADGWEQHRWLEVDRATESLPTLQRKLMAYVELAHAGDHGPAGVLPTVRVTVPTTRRHDQLRDVVAALPAPAPALITVDLFDEVFINRIRPP